MLRKLKNYLITFYSLLPIKNSTSYFHYKKNTPQLSVYVKKKFCLNIFVFIDSDRDSDSDSINDNDNNNDSDSDNVSDSDSDSE